MSLLQISEPNQSPAPHQHRYAIGIDLGTTHSLVAVVRSGKSEVLSSDSHGRLLPSIVYYGKDGIKVGKTAQDKQLTDAPNTIISAKRFMGRMMSDIKFSHPYTLKGDNDSMPSFVTAQGDISPVQVSAEILKTLASTAKQALPKDSLVGAVVTVPAYFDEAQRRATMDAATASGLNVLRLLNEPTAAAIAYGLDKSLDNKKVLVYDLGGGTFDVSLLALKDGVFEVLATGGHSALGGDDIDRLIAHYLSSFSPQTINGQQKSKLARLAKNYKEKLSQQDSIQIEVAEFGIHTKLDHNKLSNIIKPVLERTFTSIQQVFSDAKLDIHQIDDVILVGGSTRMPIIQSAVEAYFGKPALSHHNPDEVVAIGASILANQLINKNDDNVLLLDVTPLSLGLETMGGLVEVIIPRNTPIPTKKQQEFTTHSDGQTGMAIHVVQGERDTVAHCRSLARFELFGIPPMKAGLARVQVSFAIDVNGQLTVLATESRTGVHASIHVIPANGLSEAQQEALLKAGFEHAQTDKINRMLIEAQVEAKREILAIESALLEFGWLLSDDDKQALLSATKNVQAQLDNAHDKANLDEAVASLKPLADNFASLIMNNSVQTTLSGTHANDW